MHEVSSTEKPQPIEDDQVEELIERMLKSQDEALRELRKIIVGQDQVVEEVLISLYVGGNSLITGYPGLAKTLLVSCISETLGLSYSRIQFTPDLMPADITGTEILEEDRTTGKRWLQVRDRTPFCEPGPGRRDQPNTSQDPGGAPGSDAGAPRDGGR